MNPNIYRQADSRWGKLPYPTSSYSFAGNGCGCCAVTHCIIEEEEYKNYTPADVRPYMVQYATKGHGTLWKGIELGLEHYGYTVHWNQADSMSTIFNLLEKSLKRGVILFGSTKGADGTVWTGSGHYISFTDYKVENGKHYFYLKDSGGRKHDKWWQYEKSMRGDVRQVWICNSFKSKPIPKPTPKDYTLTIDGGWGYYTIITTQHIFGLEEDGIAGKNTWKAIQKKVGAKQDGKAGSETYSKMSKFLGIKTQKTRTKALVKAWQKWCNSQLKK